MSFQAPVTAGLFKALLPMSLVPLPSKIIDDRRQIERKTYLASGDFYVARDVRKGGGDASGLSPTAPSPKADGSIELEVVIFLGQPA